MIARIIATTLFRIFRDDHAEIGSIGAIGRRALAGDTRAIVQMGLVLLIATPIARVALTLVAFALQRDRLYAAITALVLALLVSGLLWSHGCAALVPACRCKARTWTGRNPRR